MKSLWIFSVTLNLIACIYAGPIEVIYSGDGCECPTKLNYQVNVPKLPMPPKYIPGNYGYKIDAPQIQAKAKVSYTFDFNVEEPKPSYPAVPEKLNLLAKIDRIALHKPDCPYLYAPPAPIAPPPSAPCSCSQCGVSKPHYRYVNGKIVQPCRCRHPKCKCNLRYPNSIIKIETPMLVASGKLEQQKNTVRRKRDLERIFFRPRRQEGLRSERYVKLYHKPISTEKDKENWLNMDFFSDANPFKRKTKKVFFPDFRSRIVKRDIKGEYDLLEKDRQEMDLTIPEIIQFMPETLQPDFKRGPCQFGCRKQFSQKKSKPNESVEMNGNQEQIINEIEKSDNAETVTSTTSATPSTDDNQVNDDMESSFTKRNANGYYYAAAVPPLPYSYMASQQNDYSAQNLKRIIHNPQDISTVSLCEQQKLYQAMRRSSDQPLQYIYDRAGQKYVDHNNQLGLVISSSRAVSDPFRSDASPLQYAADLELPENLYNAQRLHDPILGAPNYPVQHVSSEELDRIISDIIYRHPDFIDASSHYGGSLVDPAPEQAEQTMDFIKKLIDGRLGLFVDEPFDPYIHYDPVPSFQSHVRNPYMVSRSLTSVPAIYSY